MAKEDKYKEINAVKNDKLKALDAAISQIEKQYGKGSIMKLGDNSAHMNVETIPTGSLSLDIALGLGGLPKGRIIEIYGPESSGKTTVALHAVAEVQKRGGIAGFYLCFLPIYSHCYPGKLHGCCCRRTPQVGYLTLSLSR